MSSLVFAYPILFQEDDSGLMLRCRDLPEVRLDLPTGINRVRLVPVAENLLDLVLEAYILRGLLLPRASERQAGEIIISPSAAVIARAARHMDPREIRERLRTQPPVFWDFLVDNSDMGSQ